MRLSADWEDRMLEWPNSWRMDWRRCGLEVIVVCCCGGPWSRICCNVAFSGSVEDSFSESVSEGERPESKEDSPSEMSREEMGWKREA